MPAATFAALSALWLAAGFALVLWGLKIFRAWVLIVGILAGGAIGAAVAVAMVGAQDAAVAGALAGAAIGGFAAWPLQRTMVFLAAGLATAMVAAAAAVAFAGTDYIAGFSIAGFLAGGILAVALYETVIISAMAFTGSLAVFHAMYVPVDAFRGRPEDIAARLLGIYAAQFVVFVAGAAVFVAFALWYQRGPARKRERPPARAARAIAARRVSVRLAFLVVAAWIATAGLIAAGFWPVSTYELVGMHPVSWPAVALATLLFLAAAPNVVEGEGDDRVVLRNRSRGHFARTAAFAAVVPPVVTAGLFVMMGGSWDGLGDYYRAFLAGPPPVVAAKWTFSLGLLPLLLFSAHPIVVLPPPSPPETEEEGAETEDGEAAEKVETPDDEEDIGICAEAAGARGEEPDVMAEVEGLEAEPLP